jgi:hypothetical protein
MGDDDVGLGALDDTESHSTGDAPRQRRSVAAANLALAQ